MEQELQPQQAGFATLEVERIKEVAELGTSHQNSFLQHLISSATA